MSSCCTLRKFHFRFAFLDLVNASDLDGALALSGKSLKGNEITVEKAQPRLDNPPVKTPDNKFGQKGKNVVEVYFCYSFAISLQYNQKSYCYVLGSYKTKNGGYMH